MRIKCIIIIIIIISCVILDVKKCSLPSFSEKYMSPIFPLSAPVYLRAPMSPSNTS